MMGEQLGRRERLFYEFCLEDRVPANHFLRKIDAVLDLGWRAQPTWTAASARPTAIRRDRPTTATSAAPLLTYPHFMYHFLC